MKIIKGDVVQFNELHNWCGALGIVTESENSKLMIAVPIPQKGDAYMFAKPEEVEYIGRAALIPKGE